jgi:hypothetical protein
MADEPKQHTGQKENGWSIKPWCKLDKACDNVTQNGIAEPGHPVSTDTVPPDLVGSFSKEARENKKWENVEGPCQLVCVALLYPQILMP